MLQIIEYLYSSLTFFACAGCWLIPYCHHSYFILSTGTEQGLCKPDTKGGHGDWQRWPHYSTDTVQDHMWYIDTTYYCTGVRVVSTLMRKKTLMRLASACKWVGLGPSGPFHCHSHLRAIKMGKKSTLGPSTFAKVWFSSLNCKTRQNRSLNFQNRANFIPRLFLGWFCYSKQDFVFFFFQIYFGWIFKKIITLQYNIGWRWFLYKNCSPRRDLQLSSFEFFLFSNATRRSMRLLWCCNIV
jgi:hypothetical protein